MSIYNSTESMAAAAPSSAIGNCNAIACQNRAPEIAD